MPRIYQRRISRREGFLSLILGIAFLTLGCIVLLQHTSDRQRRAETLLGCIDSLAHQLNALEWETMAEGRVSGEIAAKRQQVHDQWATTLARLRGIEPHETTVDRVGAALLVYQHAVDHEFNDLTAGRFDVAREVDAREVDPSFERLDVMMSRASRTVSQAAERGNSLADLGSALALLVAALATGWLLQRFERAQRAADALKIQQQSLSASEARFRALVRNAADLIAILDPEGTLHYLSSAIERVWGYPAGTWEGQTLFSFIHPDDRSRARTMLTQVAQNGAADLTADLRLRHADGSWRIGQVALSNQLEEPGVSGIVLTGRDITERQRVEAALREREARYRGIVETTHEGILMLDAAARVTFANARMAELLRTPIAQLVGRPATDFLATTSHATFHRQFTARQYGTSDHYDVELVGAGGSSLWGTVSSTPLWDERGQFCGSLGLFHDLTARKQAEAELHRIVTRARCILWSAAIWEAPPGAEQPFYWHITISDPDAAQQIVPLDVPPGGSYADVWYDCRPLEDQAKNDQTAAAALRAGRPGYSQAFRCRDREGREHWLREEVTLEPAGPGHWKAVGVCTDVTDRQRMRRALEESEARYREMMETLPILAWRKRGDGHHEYYNRRWYAFTGLSEDESLGFGHREVIHPDDWAIYEESWEQARAARTSYSLTLRLRRHDGEYRWFQVWVAPTVDEGGEIIRWHGSASDITDVRQTQEALRSVVTQARCILWSASVREAPPGSDKAYHWETVVSDPEAAQQVVPLDILPGQHYASIWNGCRHPDDRVRSDRTGDEALCEGRPGYSQEYRCFDREGRVHWLREDVALQAYPDGTWRAVGVCIDITESKRLEGQLTHQAMHDPLTDLPNRTLFMDRLTHALDQSRRRQEPLAVVFVDLDGFKVINDSLGHRAGDELLVTAGRRLSMSVRQSDTIARLGGDEYSLLLEGVQGVAEAMAVAERALGALKAPIRLEGREVFISASMGIALATEDDTPEDLLRHADLALYEAKREGKGRWTAFDPRLVVAAWDRLQLETDLRQALDRGELRVAYQPIVDLATERIREVEALARWAHPRLGLLSAGEFVPLAEEIGLIGKIGEWVMREACRQVQGWQKRYPGREPLEVAVNVSSRQLQQADFVARIDEILKETRLTAESLKIEITESLMIQDEEQAARVLEQLRDRGVQMALDDFGTGYSALSSLRRLPLDTIKIDRSFIREMEESAGDSAIIRAIVGFGEALGLTVTAEGIETETQRKWVAALGCHRGQGYHLGKPLSAEQLEARLAGCGSGPIPMKPDVQQDV